MDLKRTITRGYTRKVNLGNYIKTRPYESADFWSSHSMEVDATKPESYMAEVSEKLQLIAEAEVEKYVSQWLMEEINKLPRKSDKIDKRQKSENSFVEDLEGTNDFGENE